MEYRDYINALRTQDPELAGEVAGFNTLENVLAWMRKKGLPLGTIDIVGQDEYSHDFLVPVGPGERHLAFGAT
jgi:hypothetical protein